MGEENQKPKVGVGVMIFKDSKVLVGKRKNSHGDGEYAFPGGSLEYMEGYEECARRETLEETGIEIKNIKFLCVGNTIIYTPKHFAHIGLTADWENGEPMVCEPEKCEGWDWYDLDKLPSPLFSLCSMMIEAYKSGKNYYDKE
jgi:8-oxo-dGTP diphosphatase